MMRRIIYRIALCALACVGATACVKDMPEHGEGCLLRISVDVPGMQTKAVTAGEAARGENTVNTISVFVLGADDDVIFRADALVPSAGAVSTYLPEDVLRGEARGDGSYAVCLVANVTVPSAGIATLSDVLSTTAQAAFDEGDASYVFPFFGTGSATLSGEGDALSASVTLQRGASRLDVRVVDIATDVDGGDGTYVPDTDHMYITFINGTTKGPVGGVAYGSGAAMAGSRYSLRSGPLVYHDGAEPYWTTENPFYSMSSDWSSDDSAEASFLLVVPWSNDGGANWKRSYYQIPINAAQMRIRENTHYVLNMSIGIIGSFEEIRPVELTASVVAQPWGTFSIVENEIRESRYLVLASTYVELNNVASTEIQFASSHDCMIYSQSMTHPVLSSSGADDEVIDPSDYTLEISAEDSKVVFRHSLDNSGAAGSDFAPYTLTFIIGHADNANHTQSVTIVQEPMIYIVEQINSDGDSNANTGYVYLNGSNTNSNYGGVHGLAGSNKNPAMYIISLSAFSEGSTYSIGDPRLSYVDNLPSYSGSSLTYTWATSASAIEGGSRRLSYYRPTESGDRTINMVAPKFRVASSYGVTSSQTYRNMQMRCASYQEDGYPAGRWRIPTAAEVMYIISLSTQGTIPELFTITSSGNGYWCANGYINGNSSGVATLYENNFSGSHSVRCVYDDWLWGSDPAVSKTTFTWGDME